MTLESLIPKSRRYMSPSAVNVVLYHAECHDGAAAALAAWCNLKDKGALYIPVSYNTNFDEKIIRGKNVLCLDFSFKKDQLLKLRSIANKIMILDHHKSAMEDLKDIPGCFFSMEHAGSMLSWHYFNTLNLECPLLFKLVEDRDLWRFEYGNETRALTCAINAMGGGKPDFDFKQLITLTHDFNLHGHIKKGREILKQERLWVKNAITNSYISTITIKHHQYTVRAINLDSGHLRSEIGNALCNLKDAEFALLWYPIDGRFKVSMRSMGDFDVSEIATYFGGGGHKNAASFNTSKDPVKLLKKPIDELSSVTSDLSLKPKF